MSFGRRPPVPDLIPIAAMGEQRPRNQPPTPTIDTQRHGSRASTPPPRRKGRRKSARRRHRDDQLKPVQPRVNPIFVWVRQENNRIVDVKCEDYDKRNRILLTKTAQGWRAIPRTETLARNNQDKHAAATAATKNTRQHKKEVKKKSAGIQVDPPSSLPGCEGRCALDNLLAVAELELQSGQWDKKQTEETVKSDNNCCDTNPNNQPSTLTNSDNPFFSAPRDKLMHRRYSQDSHNHHHHHHHSHQNQHSVSYSDSETQPQSSNANDESSPPTLYPYDDNPEHLISTRRNSCPTWSNTHDLNENEELNEEEDQCEAQQQRIESRRNSCPESVVNVTVNVKQSLSCNYCEKRCTCNCACDFNNGRSLALKKICEDNYRRNLHEIEFDEKKLIKQKSKRRERREDDKGIIEIDEHEYEDDVREIIAKSVENSDYADTDDAIMQNILKELEESLQSPERNENYDESDEDDDNNKNKKVKTDKNQNYDDEEEKNDEEIEFNTKKDDEKHKLKLIKDNSKHKNHTHKSHEDVNKDNNNYEKIVKELQGYDKKNQEYKENNNKSHSHSKNHHHKNSRHHDKNDKHKKHGKHEKEKEEEIKRHKHISSSTKRRNSKDGKHEDKESSKLHKKLEDIKRRKLNDKEDLAVDKNCEKHTEKDTKSTTTTTTNKHRTNKDCEDKKHANKEEKHRERKLIEKDESVVSNSNFVYQKEAKDYNELKSIKSEIKIAEEHEKVLSEQGEENTENSAAAVYQEIVEEEEEEVIETFDEQEISKFEIDENYMENLEADILKNEEEDVQTITLNYVENELRGEEQPQEEEEQEEVIEEEVVFDENQQLLEYENEMENEGDHNEDEDDDVIFIEGEGGGGEEEEEEELTNQNLGKQEAECEDDKSMINQVEEIQKQEREEEEHKDEVKMYEESKDDAELLMKEDQRGFYKNENEINEKVQIKKYQEPVVVLPPIINEKLNKTRDLTSSLLLKIRKDLNEGQGVDLQEQDKPTDLSKKNKFVFCDDQPTDLSIPKKVVIPPFQSPRPPSQNSETMQSPQPSGIPAVPPSPDQFIAPSSQNQRTKLSSVSASAAVAALSSSSGNSTTGYSTESLLIPSQNLTISVVTEKEPLDLGKNRASASPTVTCSEEAKKKSVVEELSEPQAKKSKMSVSVVESNEKLLELLKPEVNALAQLKALINNHALKIPDPMLVPKEKLSAIISSPGSEIPKLLAERPELRLPEALAYPHLLQDPDILVITLNQLQMIIHKQSQPLPLPSSSSSSSSSTNNTTTSTSLSDNQKNQQHQQKIQLQHQQQQAQNQESRGCKRSYDNTLASSSSSSSNNANNNNNNSSKGSPKLSSSSSSSTLNRNVEVNQERTSSSLTRNNSSSSSSSGGGGGKINELANDIDAATKAAFNQMIWLPYINQLEAAAMAFGNNPEFMKLMNSMMVNNNPFAAQMGQQQEALQHMMGLKFPPIPPSPQVPLSMPAVIPPSPTPQVPSSPGLNNYPNPHLWQEAMMQANMLNMKQRSTAMEMMANNKNMYREYMDKMAAVASQSQSQNQSQSQSQGQSQSLTLTKKSAVPQLPPPNQLSSFQRPNNKNQYYSGAKNMHELYQHQQQMRERQKQQQQHQQQRQHQYQNRSSTSNSSSTSSQNKNYGWGDYGGRSASSATNNNNHLSHINGNGTNGTNSSLSPSESDLRRLHAFKMAQSVAAVRQSQNNGGQNNNNNSKSVMQELAAAAAAAAAAASSASASSSGTKKDANSKTIPIDLSGNSLSGGRLRIMDPSSYGQKKLDEVGEVGSTTTSFEEMQDAQKHLWHPLFGNQKNYSNPWPWSAVSAAGE